jgi:hypothetical protein
LIGARLRALTDDPARDLRPLFLERPSLGTVGGRFEQQREIEVANIERVELERHRGQIIADVKHLVERYRAIFDWDVPDVDQALADGLILAEIRKALDDIEQTSPN